MPARAIDTATISFGLVSIPVKIYSTNEPSHELHFHLVHEGCGERLKQYYECPRHGRVERDEMIKGFEISRGNFVELSKEELKALEAVASDAIEVREFVPLSAIDPLYITASYYLAPDRGGDRAYRLMRDALEHADLAAVAAYAARGKEYIVMLRPFEDGLVMHQLRYADEVKPWSEVGMPTLAKPKPAELGMAGKLIDQLRHDEFDASQYTDEVKGRVRHLIAEKAKGGEIVAPTAEPRPEVGDLMAALKASLAGEGPTPTQAAHARGGRRAGARAAARSPRKHTATHDGDRRNHRGSRARPHTTRRTRSASHASRAHR
ncbi:MAG TPA: Ku protein [Kofleriaceae bacterium]|nr:Ku protein [Kofleriaceae bacterium]